MEHKEIKLRIPWPRIRSGQFDFRRLLPTPGNVIFTLLMIALLMLAQSVGALPLPVTQHAPRSTSTSTIAYQGRLADSAGAPLTGTYNMIFRLYEAGTGGTPLWEEQWTGSNDVRVSDGLFNVMLGSLTPIQSSVISSQSALYLGVTVGTDDEMTPRVQLGSVPFAVQALTVPDGSVTTAKIADGAVTQDKLGADVSLVPPDGSITTAKLADGAVTSRQANLVAKFNAQDALCGTTSTTWMSCANRLMVTLNLEVQQYVQIMYSVVAYSSSTGPGDTRSMTMLFIDGVEQGAVSFGATTSIGSGMISRVFQAQLMSGSHEVEVRFKSGNSGNTATFERGTLLVTALSTTGGS